MRPTKYAVSMLLVTAIYLCNLPPGSRSTAISAGEPSAVERTQQAASGSNRQRRSVDHLVKLEERLLPRTLQPGDQRQENLPDYYWAENKPLKQRFEQIRARYQQANPSLRALTLIAGTAGVGKTFIKHEVCDKSLPPSVLCKLDLRELYESWSTDGITNAKADLYSDDITISEMLSVSDKQSKVVRDYLMRKPANFFIIDSVDEVHPDDHQWIMEQIAEFLVNAPQRFIHVAVFGRDEAFRELRQTISKTRELSDTQIYRLNPPRFESTGDLLVSSWNYHVWKYRLKWAPTGSDLQKMPLEVYVRWAASGYSREGSFQSVTFAPNVNMQAAVQNELSEWAQSHLIASSTLTNLAGNSLTREIQQRAALAGQEYDERRFKREFIDSWMVRDTKSSNRPSSERPQYHQLYLTLLQQVAVRYSAIEQLDNDGFFSVAEEDVVAILVDGREFKFPVRKILDRSGMKTTNLVSNNVSQYRFDPIWIHRLLVEMHNESIE